jgi:hypothetical protein
LLSLSKKEGNTSYRLPEVLGEKQAVGLLYLNEPQRADNKLVVFSIQSNGVLIELCQEIN